MVTDADQARQCPELALLSVLAHGQSEHGLDVGMAAYQGAAGLDRETRMLYSDMILDAVHQVARVKMEEWMHIEDYEWKSDLALRNQAKGRAEGKAEGVATALLMMLSARDLQVTEEQKAQILSCNNLDTLNVWIGRVLLVSNVKDLLR